MRERISISGTSEERWRQVEVILNQFRRRLGRKVVGVLPPTVVLHSVQVPDGQGIIFRGIVPINGTLGPVYLYIGQYVTVGPTITFRIAMGNVSRSVSRELNTMAEMLELDWPLRAGGILEAFILPVEAVRDVMLAFVIKPTLGEFSRDEFLLDTLLALEESGDAI